MPSWGKPNLGGKKFGRLQLFEPQRTSGKVMKKGGTHRNWNHKREKKHAKSETEEAASQTPLCAVKTGGYTNPGREEGKGISASKNKVMATQRGNFRVVVGGRWGKLDRTRKQRSPKSDKKEQTSLKDNCVSQTTPKVRKVGRKNRKHRRSGVEVIWVMGYIGKKNKKIGKLIDQDREEESHGAHQPRKSS